MLCLVPIFVLPWIVGLVLKHRHVHWASRWYFGLLSIGILLMLCHALGLPLLVTYLFVLLLLIGCAFLYAQNKQASAITEVRAFEFSFPVLALLPLLVTSYIHILSHPVAPADWDAISTWFFRVKLLYIWAPLKNAGWIDWGSYINYPHLGPMLETWVIHFTGQLLETHGRLVIPTLYFFWALNHLSLAPQVFRRVYFLFIAFLGYVFFEMHPFVNGYQDGMVAILAGMSLIHFARFFMREDELKGFHPDVFLGFFYAGALALVKSEGVFLGLIISLSASLSYFLKKPGCPLKFALRIGPYLLMQFLFILAWPLLIQMSGHDASQLQNKAFTLSTVIHWYQNLERWEVIGPYFGNYFLQKLPILLACLLVSIGSFILQARSRCVLGFLWSVWVLHLIFVALPYFATLSNLHWHLANSFDRLIFQHFAFYAVILAVGVSFLADKLGSFSSKT